MSSASLATYVANDDADANHAPMLHRTGPGGQGLHLPGDREQKPHNLIQKKDEQLGHPHSQRFVRILQLGGASPEAIAVAKNLNCSMCARLKRPEEIVKRGILGLFLRALGKDL